MRIAYSGQTKIPPEGGLQQAAEKPGSESDF
jgi:hypothetical protein